MPQQGFDPNKLYDETYYREHCGSQPLERVEPWLSFFGHIAERVVMDFGPRTVLDVGCATGILVEALRALEVDAQGFDISEYAVSQVPDALRPYVKVGSILDPDAASGRFDVVICIEVLEHLQPDEADKAIENLCRWGDQVLFSSSPDHYDEPTHFNVQQPGYWAEKFAQRGFIQVLDYDTSYISPQAVLFRRQVPPLWTSIVRQYTDALWLRSKETRYLREYGYKLQERLKSSTHLLDSQLKPTQEQLKQVQEEYGALETRLKRAQDDYASLMTQHITVKRIHDQLTGQIAQYETRLTEAQNLFDAAQRDYAGSIALYETQAAELRGLLEKAYNDYAESITQYEARAAIHESLLTQMREERAALLDERDHLQGEISQIREELDRLRAEYAHLHDNLVATRADLEAKNSQIAELAAAQAAAQAAEEERNRVTRLESVALRAGPLPRSYYLLRTSAGILFRQGPVAFLDRLIRWLRGERRYYIREGNAVQQLPQAQAEQTSPMEESFPETYPDPAPFLSETLPVPSALPTPAPLEVPESVAASTPLNQPAGRYRPDPNDFSVLYVMPLPEISSKRYRVYHRKEYLQQFGIRCEHIDEVEFHGKLEWARQFDIVIFMRVAHTPDIEAFIGEMRQLGKRTVYEIDDNVFDLNMLAYMDAVKEMPPDEVEMYGSAMLRFRKLLTMCDYFIGSTMPLVERAKALGRKAYLLRNSLSQQQLDLAQNALAERERNLALDEWIRIGYQSGTKTHRVDFAVAVPVLRRILADFPETVLILQGHVDLPPELKEFEARVERRPFVPWEELFVHTSHLDIAIAPLEANNPFTLCKSALKYFESGLVEVPVVATPIEDFRHAIQHGVNGMLAATEDEWYSALRALVTDPELRRRIGMRARQDVLSRYAPQPSAQRTMTVMQSILQDLPAPETLPKKPEPVFLRRLMPPEPTPLIATTNGPKPVSIARPVYAIESSAYVIQGASGAGTASQGQANGQDLLQEITGNGERVVEAIPDLVFQAHLSIYQHASQFVAGKRVVDAGCGTGYGTYLLAQSGAVSVEGVDVSEAAIAYCKAHYRLPNLSFRVADLQTVSFEPGSLDFAFSSNAAEHLADVDMFFRAIHRALAPDGLFYLAVPPIVNQLLLEDNLKNPYHLSNLFTRHWITKLDRYFEDIQCYQHWVGEGVSTDFFNPDRHYRAEDFAFFPMAAEDIILSQQTLTLVMLAQRPRAAIRGAETESPDFPADWSPDLIARSAQRLADAKAALRARLSRPS